MAAVSARDLSAALGLAALAAEVQEGDDIAGVLLPALCRLVDCPATVLHEVDLVRAEEWNLFHPATLADPDVIAGYASTQTEHPFFVAAASGDELTGIRVSDLMSRRAWHATSVYAAALRRLGTEDQMTTTLRRHGPVADAVSVVTDGRAFTDRQRDLLLLVRPHLAAALARTHRPGAVHRMYEVGPSPRWHVGACDAATTTSLRLLTPAERRVLGAVATGLSSAQVARRAGIAHRTVDKHLEHTYAKLGVTNRMEALAASGLVVGPRTAEALEDGSRRTGTQTPTSLPGCRLSSMTSAPV